MSHLYHAQEMEMRARADTGMSQELTASIPPIAASLHDAFLLSRCSSCFRPLQHHRDPSSPNGPISCLACSASILYCSPRCSASDSGRHAATGECHFFYSLLAPSPPSRPGDTADLRTALRLLHSLDTLGLTPTPTYPSPPPRRIGGLLASGLEAVLEEGGELAERIREGGALMSRARGAGRACDDLVGAVSVEEVALWAVMTNAVEVEVGEVGAVGIAVYGPRFSWFNHSCSPNACFRFELSPPSEPPLSPPDAESDRVSPEGSEETAVTAWKAWGRAESKLSHGLSRYGPVVVVRSVKPIKKNEEVCITYIDLLQPKAMRHSDLWLKFRFVCCCERCSATPQMYVDYILSCNARELNSDQSNNIDMDCEEIAECLDQAIAEYMSDGNPEACCEELENLLSESFEEKQLQAEEPSTRKFKLHPLHYLSLNAYITLASAYKVRASNLLAIGSDEDNILEAFKINRVAAAYSLLLAGATHQLFLFESSLIASVAQFFINAGESILHLVRSSMWGSIRKTNELDHCFFYCSPCPTTKNSVSWDEFKAASTGFLSCLFCVLLKSWRFIVQGLPCLENIKSPIDFNWLGIANIAPLGLSGGISNTNFCKHAHFEFGHTAGIHIEEDTFSLIQLAFHCLFYGTYLASVCYGSHCYLAEHAKELLHVLCNK